MEKKELRQINTTALAYLGDAVYEQAVREHILRKGTYNANNLHTSAVKYVKAQAQAGSSRSNSRWLNALSCQLI